MSNPLDMLCPEAAADSVNQPDASASLVEADRVVALLDIEDLEKLMARRFTPRALGRARRASRDARLLRLAIGMPGRLEAVAERLHRDLCNYAATTWRYERGGEPPSDGRRKLMFRILTNTRDHAVPSVSTIKRALRPSVQKRLRF